MGSGTAGNRQRPGPDPCADASSPPSSGWCCSPWSSCVPLGLIIATRDLDDAVRELEWVAERGAASLEPGPLAPGDSIDLPGHGSNIDIAVYDGMVEDRGGRPDPAEPFVLESATRITRCWDPNECSPIRSWLTRNASAPFALWNRPTRRTKPFARASGPWRSMSARSSSPAASCVGRGPIQSTAAAVPYDAVRLGDGDFSIEPQRCGVPELDETAAALAETASRLDDVLARERAFSSDASLSCAPRSRACACLETELVPPRTDPTAALAEVLTDVDRLETTIDTLLAVARDRPRMREPLDPDDLAQSLRTRWATGLDAVGRRLSVDLVGHPLTHVNRGVLDEILDVLVSNAARARTRIGARRHRRRRRRPSRLTVTDGGALDQNTDSVFVHGHSGAGGHGLGLTLARSLAEAPFCCRR